MPERHRNTKHSFKSNSGHTQSECSTPSYQGGPRAPPAVPGRIPLREEAELLQGVTKASAEPATGAILSGPANFHSEGLSPQQMEFDFETSRLGPTKIPLRNNNSNNNILESLLISAPSNSGGIPIERNFTLANSGADPTTLVLSEMEMDESTSQPDINKQPLLITFTLNDKIMSRNSFTFTDKTYTFSLFSEFLFKGSNLPNLKWYYGSANRILYF